MITLTVTYHELETLISFSHSLIGDLNWELANAKDPTDKARLTAYFYEVMAAHDAMKKKRAMWPMVNKKNVTRKIKISHMQGFIYWVNYRVETHDAMIVEQINQISKQLIN